MAESLGRFLLGIFGGNEYVATLFVSMFPLIELKGAIPIGTGLFGLNLWVTAGVAYLGSTLISIVEFFILLPVFALLKKIGLTMEKKRSTLYTECAPAEPGGI